MSDAPIPTFRMTRGRRIGDRSMIPLIRLGLVPHTYLLTTRGRRTGQPRTTPVTLVEHDGQQWLVAPYGPVSWVLNARAAGEVSLRRRGRPVAYRIRELGAAEAGPVLRDYVVLTRPTRRYFTAAVGDPAERFAAEAGRHPVFELSRIR